MPAISSPYTCCIMYKVPQLSSITPISTVQEFTVEVLHTVQNYIISTYILSRCSNIRAPSYHRVLPIFSNIECFFGLLLLFGAPSTASGFGVGFGIKAWAAKSGPSTFDVPRTLNS